MNTKTQKILGLFLTIGLMAMLPAAAQAQCGSILTSNTTLAASFSCAGGNGLEIAASNITLDCAGHTISGPGSGIGILLNNVSQVTVVNCTVDNFGVGFRVDGGNDNGLINNKAMNNQGASGGFNIVNGSTGNVLEANGSGFNAGRGFSVNNSHGNVLIDNYAFGNGFRGFDIINSNANYLFGNSAVRNSSAGMIVQDYLGGTSTGNLLDFNYIDGSGAEGLAMFASNNTVNSLTSNNNGTWGIREKPGAVGNSYSGNTCAGNLSGPSTPGTWC